VTGDSGDPERGGEVRLAGAGPTEKDDVMGGLGEGQVGELGDQAFVDLGLFEVEAREVAMPTAP